MMRNVLTPGMSMDAGAVGAGGTDLSWSAAAVFGYHFGARDQFGVKFGYRHLAFEFEKENGPVTVKSDFAIGGPLIGFTFGF